MGDLQTCRPVVLVFLYAAASAAASWVACPDPTTNNVFSAEPAAAVILFALAHLPRRLWTPLIGFTLVFEVMVRWAMCPDIEGALLRALQTSLHAVVTGAILARFGRFSYLQTSLTGSVGFAAAVILGAISAATLCSLLGLPLGRDPSFLSWQLGWLGDALGVSAALPFMLAWRHGPSLKITSIDRGCEVAGLIFLWGLFAALASDKSSESHAEILFLLVPIFVWTASRFGLPWGTMGNLVFVLLTPWIQLVHPSSGAWIASQHAFVLMLVLSSLWLSVLLEEREEALRSSEANEARLRAVLASIPEMVFQVNAAGHCVDRLGAAIDLTPTDEPASLDAILPPDNIDLVRSAVQEVLTDNQPRSRLMSSEKSHGEAWVEARVAPVHAHLSSVEPSAMVSIRDVTADQLSQRRAAAAEKASALQNLTGGVAHDFNNLLTTIIGNLDLIRGDLRNPEHLASLDDVSRAANRGRELTRNLLAYSESQPLQPKTLNLAKFLPNLIDHFRRKYPVPLYLLSEQMKEGPWTVRVDPERLENALRSLVENAQDACKSPGIIHIRADRRSMVVEPGEPVRAFVRLAIEDNGEGMSPQTLSRACDPFFSTRGVGRTGLGLSMVQGFARQSGGQLRLRSRIGKGTQAALLLPLIELPPQEEIHNTGLPHRDSVIIAADRDSNVRRLVGRHAARLGYVALEAASTEDAETLLQRLGKVALVIAEQDLPGGQSGGLGLLRNIPSQPAILLAEQVPLPNLPNVLQKPFEPGALGKLMGDLLMPRPLTPIPVSGVEDSWPPITSIRAPHS